MKLVVFMYMHQTFSDTSHHTRDVVHVVRNLGPAPKRFGAVQTYVQCLHRHRFQIQQACVVHQGLVVVPQDSFLRQCHSFRGPKRQWFARRQAFAQQFKNLTVFTFVSGVVDFLLTKRHDWKPTFGVFDGQFQV